MKHLRVAQTIAAPAASVWRLLSVFDYWPEWGTSITAVDAAADRVTDGMTGRVRTIAGIWLPFRVTAVDPGRSWDWAVAGFPATGHRVIAIDATACRLELTTPWITAPYLLVLRRAARNLRRMAEQR